MAESVQRVAIRTHRAADGENGLAVALALATTIFKALADPETTTVGALTDSVQWSVRCC